MRIDRKEIGSITLDSIEYGDVFKYDGKFFLKIQKNLVITKDYPVVNMAVNIETGEIATFHPNTLITFVEGIFVEADDE